MTTKNIKISDSDSLRLRVAEAKAQLKAMGHHNYLKDFIAKHKQYDNHADITHITSVFQLRKVDKDVTRKIEAYVEKLKKAA